MKVFRHGDLGLVEVSSLPEGLKKSNLKILMNGSGGHNHTFAHGEFYPNKKDLVIGYLVANNRTRLYHPEHGNICSVCNYSKLKSTNICPKCGTDFIKEGKLRIAKPLAGIYELIKQFEDTHDGMKPVED